jgi:hypothetical protein
MPACDGEDEEGGTTIPPGFVYVINYDSDLPTIRKFTADTHERILAYTPNGLCIAAALDSDNGDLYVHSWGSLRRYDKDGNEIYLVMAETARYTGREYLGFNNETGQVYFLNGEGICHRFRGSDGERIGIFNTGLEDPEGIVIDEVENTEWVLGNGGAVAQKYTDDGYNLLVELTAGPYTKIVVDDSTDTILMGVSRAARDFVVRYSKAGVKQQEIETTIVPTALAVEPGSGRIWVSDGGVVERYKPDGTKIEGVNSMGFQHIDFTEDGAVAFAIDPDGFFYAIDVRTIGIFWRIQQTHPGHNIHFVKYTKY